MKNNYARDLREGMRVEDVFLVTSKSVMMTREGKPYLKLRLADRTGQIDAVKWAATEPEIARFSESDYILVHGTVRTYNDSLQLTLESVQKWGQEVDPADFIRISESDPQEMMAELMDILSSVTNADLARLIIKIFSDEEIARRFCQAPAAKKLHHACIGGLVEHTLNVVKICSAFAKLYPAIDRDLLLTAAALHDIGKIEEYTWSKAIDFSESGHFVGHIVAGAIMVKEAVNSLDGFDQLTSLALQHAIIAHHGMKEWGSPKRPKSIEAVMLHSADDLDAKVAMFNQAIEDSDNSGESGLFTKRHFHLDRPIFKGQPRQALSEQEQSDEDDSDLDLLAVDSDYDPFADE